MRILLVEDDELLGDGIYRSLQQYKYTVDWIKNGEAAAQALRTEDFDLVILDWSLPRLSGLEVLKGARAKNIKTPIVILTARDSTEDRVTALDQGADDYITKPFELEELCARIRALLRRAGGRAKPLLIVDDIKLDPAARTVHFHDQLVELSRREFNLLQMLMENAGKVLSREKLSQSLYGWRDNVDSNALEVHIHNLRKKFGTKFISTIRGIGYVIEKK